MTVQSIAEFYSHTEVGAELQKQGLKKGIEQGQEQGTARTLGALLRSRFGDQPQLAAVAAQLAHSDDLDASVRIVAEAATLDDVIAGLPALS